MNNPLVNQAAMVLPVFLLSACLGGGGGSFDLDSVDTEAPRPAPKYQDVSSEKPQAQKDQGGYGFAMRFKRRNRHPMVIPKETEVKLNPNDWEATGLPTEPKKLPLKQESVISQVQANNGDNNIYTSPYLTQSNHQNGNTGNGVNQPKNQAKGYENFQYVYSGWFYKHAKPTIDQSQKKFQQGDDGYIFYHGKEPSRQLPASGKVTYKGVWHFVTDTKQGQKFNDILETSKGQGDKYSGFSGDEGETTSNRTDSNLNGNHEGYGFTSNLEVDFDNKKLTGKLIRNNNNRVTNATTGDKHTTQYYSLEAQVTGNRFNGKAMATDKPGTGETKQHPFVSDSSSLSGGFFGPKGEELGFRFLSDDKKVAVVGSAKTKDKAESGGSNGASGGTDAAASNGAAGTSSENSKLTTVLDAVELTHGGKAIKNLDNFSNAAQLVVDGIMIPLLPKDSESGNNQANQGTNGGTAFTRKFDHTPNSDEKDTQAGTAENGNPAASNTAGDTNGKTKTYAVEVCCSNLNYLKYGLLTRKTAGNTGEGGNGSPTAAAQTDAQSMFLQGERTDEKEIPNDQNIVYRGSWYGHIANGTSWSGNASNATSGNKADFTVNFGEKKINGTLTAENRQAATFTIEGTIQGNGFSGTAKTADSGFDLDQSNTTRTPKAYITNAKVQGGFYGPKAEELGGWFAYPGDSQAQPSASGSGTSAANSATVVFGAKRQQLVQ
ncbi:TPA: transferrin-binding protein-like solute binding protein [Neisseria meningitidis]